VPQVTATINSELPPQPAPLDPDRLDPMVWKISAVVLLGPLMSQMDSTVVNVSLANIRDAFHSSISSAQWIISAYLLALALMLPLSGWLVDRLGAKRIYLSCFSAFTLASVLCGAAKTMDQLILARILQGAAGGLLAPMTQMMIARIAGKHLARVIGYVAMPVFIAPLIGPVVAGLILKHAPWPWLFYINLPIGILAVVLAAIILPKDESSIQKRRFDFLGFSLISPGLACLLYGFEQVSHHESASPLILGVVLIGLFVWHAKLKKSDALIDLRLFERHTFSVATQTQFFFNGLSYAGQFLVPLYLITGCGLTPVQAGWLLAPMGVGMLCASPTMGYLTDRFGCRWVSVAGVFVAISGTLPFFWMIHTQLSNPLLIICLFVRGAGQGAIGVPTISAAYAGLPKEKIALATTAINIVQRLGGPIATTVMAIVLSIAATHFSATDHRTFFIAFGMLVALQLLVLVSAIRLPVRVKH
jgi:EmrB/QacA subfamily drug resistance transporter